MGEFHAWTQQQLQGLLGFDGVNDIVEHLMIVDEKEINSYLQVNKYTI